MDNEPQKTDNFTIKGSDSGKGSDFGQDDISAAIFREERNERRIEKLATRLTIISVIIPCLIAATLFFAYVDIKERMSDVQTTDQNKAQDVAEELGSKINAMTVDFAEVKHKLATSTPVVDETIKKIDATIKGIDATIKKLESSIAKLTAAAKADKAETASTVARIEKAVSDNAAASNQALKNLEETYSKATARNPETEKTVAENTRLIKTAAEKTRLLESAIDKLTTTLSAEQGKMAALTKENTKDKETFALLQKEQSKVTKNVAAYEDRIASLQKELGLLKIKTDTLEQETLNGEMIEHKLNLIRSDYDRKIDHLTQLVLLIEKNAKADSRAAPAKIAPDKILEKDLLQ